MAAWAELGQRHVRRGGLTAQTQGGLPIDLHHQMGAQTQLARVRQGPIAHAQLEGPGPSRQHGAIGWRQYVHPWLPFPQPFAQLLHGTRGRHLLEVARGRGGRQRH